MKNSFTISDIADKIGATVDGDGGIIIDSAAPVETAKDGQLTFISNEKYIAHLQTTKASAIVLDFDILKPEHLTVIRHKNPYYAFALILDILYPHIIDVAVGVDKSAVVSDKAEIDPAAHIGPLCNIKKASIGAGTKIVSSVFIGDKVSIGKNCIIYPGVTIMDGTIIGNNVIIHSSTVIGSDGFGFAESDQGLKKIKQIGWVEIEDMVEIGSNVSVDRGALGPTKIGMGTKIDNLVQVAHNVEIGRHTIIISQVGISGSTIIGNGVIIAGQVGMVGHIEIGDGAKVGAQSGVSKSIPAGKTMFGSPAREIMESKRIEACLSRLPDLLKRVKKLENQLKDK